jgi:hypothetical protein
MDAWRPENRSNCKNEKTSDSIAHVYRKFGKYLVVSLGVMDLVEFSRWPPGGHI